MQSPMAGPRGKNTRSFRGKWDWKYEESKSKVRSHTAELDSKPCQQQMYTKSACTDKLLCCEPSPLAQPLDWHPPGSKTRDAKGKGTMQQLCHPALLSSAAASSQSGIQGWMHWHYVVPPARCHLENSLTSLLPSHGTLCAHKKPTANSMHWAPHTATAQINANIVFLLS